MKSFKIIVALLASTSLVSAAANLRTDENGACVFTFGDMTELERIVEGGDDPTPLAKMIDECRSLKYTSVLDLWMFEMIRLHRPALFQFLFPFLDFAVDAMRNDYQYVFLQYAMRNNSIEIADYLLGRGLGIEHHAGRGLWLNAATSKVLLQLLKGHPEQAAGLSPTSKDMGAVENGEHARILAQAAKFCDSVTDQHNFDATSWLEELAANAYYIKPHGLAEVAHYLIQEEGAHLSNDDRDRLAIHPGVLELLKEWSELDVKEPEGN